MVKRHMILQSFVNIWTNKFFDQSSIRNLIDGVKNKSYFPQPYTDLNDEHFKWLKNDLIQPLLNWKLSIFDRPGNFSQTEKGTMFQP